MVNVVRALVAESELDTQHCYPIINRVWLSRWRKRYNLVPRMITCCYKVSYARKLLRLGVLWRNAARLLAFHELLYGKDKLTFVSVDEKPFRFNATTGDRVWALRGAKHVKCKEKRKDFLERWTGITAVYSRPYRGLAAQDGPDWQGWQPKWAALFKAKDGSRSGLVAPSADVKILFAECGSVTTDTWLDYLDWSLPHVVDAEHAIVLTTDWYAPHLAEDAIRLARMRTTSPTLFIGGGTTAEAAVCDKKPHRDLQRIYKALEAEDALEALQLQPEKVPSWSKTDVLARGWQAWNQLDHAAGRDLHISCGYTTALDGTQDHLLDSSIDISGGGLTCRGSEDRFRWKCGC